MLELKSARITKETGTAPSRVKDVLFNSIIEQPKVALFEASGNRTFVVEDNYGYLYEFNVCNNVCLCARLWMGQGSTPSTINEQTASKDTTARIAFINPPNVEPGRHLYSAISILSTNPRRSWHRELLYLTQT